MFRSSHDFRHKVLTVFVLALVFFFIGRLSQNSPSPSIEHSVVKVDSGIQIPIHDGTAKVDGGLHIQVQDAVAKLDSERHKQILDLLKTISDKLVPKQDSPSHLFQSGHPEGDDNETGKEFLTIYNLSKDTSERILCLDMEIEPKTKVCLHNALKDRTVSGNLLVDRVWEKDILLELKADLELDPSFGLLDIGANIGVYSLFAAAMGKKVVAVEPFIENIHRLQRAAILGGSVKRITLLQNAISDKRASGTLRLSTFNQGDTRLVMDSKPCADPSCPPSVKTILLSDLQYVAPFDKAIMKMDIQGYEHLALTTIEQLLVKIDIRAIYMEWEFMREMPAAGVPKVEHIIQLLRNNGFTPRSLRHQGDVQLEPNAFRSWPFDMVWRR